MHGETANMLEGPSGRKLSQSKVWAFGILISFFFFFVLPLSLKGQSNLPITRGRGSHLTLFLLWRSARWNLTQGMPERG